VQCVICYRLLNRNLWVFESVSRAFVFTFGESVSISRSHMARQPISCDYGCQRLPQFRYNFKLSCATQLMRQSLQCSWNLSLELSVNETHTCCIADIHCRSKRLRLEVLAAQKTVPRAVTYFFYLCLHNCVDSFYSIWHGYYVYLLFTSRDESILLSHCWFCAQNSAVQIWVNDSSRIF